MTCTEDQEIGAISQRLELAYGWENLETLIHPWGRYARSFLELLKLQIFIKDRINTKIILVVLAKSKIIGL